MTASPLGYSVSFPVFLADVAAVGLQVVSEIRGTAFALPNSFMLTAGHVAREILAAKPQIGVVGLRDRNGAGFVWCPVREMEELPGDIAVLLVDVTVASADSFEVIGWSRTLLNSFENVKSLGFAYGTLRVDDRVKTVQRGFAGHVVSRIIQFKPVGWPKEAFAVYELSFAAPIGLSGAPLFGGSEPPVIHGVIIGNSDSKMLVFRSEERVEESGTTNVVEQYEGLRLGLAVTADHILASVSQLLGGSVSNFLESHGRVR